MAAAAPPGATSASPGATLASPRPTSASPRPTSASPGATLASPRPTSASPGTALASPGPTSASPGPTSASPGPTSAIPGADPYSPGSPGSAGVLRTPSPGVGPQQEFPVSPPLPPDIPEEAIEPPPAVEVLEELAPLEPMQPEPPDERMLFEQREEEPRQKMREYLQAVKCVEEYVGENLVRGKLIFESKPAREERLGPDGWPIRGMDGWDGQPMMGGSGGRSMDDGGLGRGRYGGKDYRRPSQGMDGREYGTRPMGPDMRERDKQRFWKDPDELYYGELRRGPAETRIPIRRKSETHSRAELIIEKIRQDIEAFEKDVPIQGYDEPVRPRSGGGRVGKSREDFDIDDWRERRWSPRDVEEVDPEGRFRRTGRSMSSNGAFIDARTRDKKLADADCVFRYESKPLLVVKPDAYRKEEAEGAAGPGQEGGQPRRESADRGLDVPGGLDDLNDLQEFLLEARTRAKNGPQDMEDEFLPRREAAGSRFPHGELAVQSNKGVGGVIRPVGNLSPTCGSSPRRGKTVGFQSFTVQAKPTLGVARLYADDDVDSFAVQAIPEPREICSQEQLIRLTRQAAYRPAYEGSFCQPGPVRNEEQVEPITKTEWRSWRVDDYEEPGRPHSRRTVVHHDSPRMVSATLPIQQRRVYDEAVEGVLGCADYGMDEDAQQFLQINRARERGQAQMYQVPQRMVSPQGQFMCDEYMTVTRKRSPVQNIPMQPVPMQNVPMPCMQDMRGMPVQNVPMQMMPMKAVQRRGQSISCVPMQGVHIRTVPMQIVPMQDDRRLVRVPMRIDRRLQQVILQQTRGVPPVSAQMERRFVTPMPPIQAQNERDRLLKFMIQQDRRQQQAPAQEDNKEENKEKSPSKPEVKDANIETTKEQVAERVLSDVNIQVTESRRSKGTTARVKTCVAASATHEAGTMRNVELQAEMDEEEQKMWLANFSKDPAYAGLYAGGGFMPPGFSYPPPGSGYQLHQAYQTQALQLQQPSIPVPSSYSVHTSRSHEHHHHHPSTKQGFKIAYLLPKSSERESSKTKPGDDLFEDQEPLGAAVGVQCQSLYERLLNWLYPDTKPTEDRSLMTDSEQILENSRKPPTSKNTKETSKKEPTKGKGEKESIEAKRTEELEEYEEQSEGKDQDKVEEKAAGRAEKEDDDKEKGTKSERKGKKGEAKDSKDENKKKGPSLDAGSSDKKDVDIEKATAKTKQKRSVEPPISVNLPWHGRDYEYEEQIKKDGTCVGKYTYKGLGGGPKFFHSPRSQLSPKPSDKKNDWQYQLLPSKRSEVIQEGQRPEVSGESDSFVPEVQIRVDFNETPDSRSKSKKSGLSDVWQAPNMVVSYAHKNFEKSSVSEEEDDDDDYTSILQSDPVHCHRGSTRKLLKRKGRHRRMADKELLAYSVAVVVAVVALTMVVALSSQRMHGNARFCLVRPEGLGLDHHLVFNLSNLRATRKDPNFRHAAPTRCRDARCLTRGLMFLKILGRNYSHRACSDFHSFVCEHPKFQVRPATASHDDLMEGLLAVIKSEKRYPELITARMLYKECLSKGKSDAIAERGWDPLAELQADTGLRGWPFTDPVQQPLVWKAAARLLRRFNEPALLSVGVEIHPHKRNEQIISIGEPHLLLSPMVHNQSLRWYYAAVAQALQPFKENLVAPLFAMEVSSFEDKLARMVHPRPLVAVQTVAALAPELRELLDIVLENIAKVTPTTELLVKSPQYVKGLLVLVKSTTPHTVLNYLGFREIVVAAPFLPEKLHGLSALGRSSLLRKYVCLEVVAESLPVMSLYASSHAFKQGLQDFTNSNVSVAAKDVVTGLVSKMNWMDKRTKDEVKKKISGSQLRTFHPRWIFDKFKVFAQYENVPTICEGEGLRSYVSIRKSLFENKMKGEASRINERWLGTVLDQSCSFDVHKRSIYAPFSFLNISSPTHDNHILAHIPGTVSKLSHCLVELLLDEGN
ncbi:unnamed protein product [Ixodes pacificus]